jgi:uncharacterized protein YcbX
MKNSAVISSLHFYPVKSCQAVDIESAYAGPRGFTVGKILDRSWMLINENDTLISQRQEPSLARVKVDLLYGKDGIAERVRLSALGFRPIDLDPSLVGNDKQRVIIHGQEAVGSVASEEISRWFSEFLGRATRVIHQKEGDVRLFDQNFGAEAPQKTVSFADGFPYLITTRATLEKLNELLDSPVPMQRFRANIVIGNTLPDAEYTWRSVTAGEAAFNLEKPCTRCVMTTIDQELGKKIGKEPLATLARTYFLAQDFGSTRVQGAIFGENAIPTSYGTVSVGDEVRVVGVKPLYNFRNRGMAANL